MTDRELLEKAAKAAGYVVRDGEYEDGGLLCHDGNKPVRFNPLTDDGDALRLAVKMKIDIAHFSNFVRADVSGHDDCHESNGEDACASLRRAIVRSAASVGESL